MKDQDSTLLDSIDPSLLNRLSTRRDALSRVLKLGTAATTVPLVLATMATEAHGKSLPAEVVEVLRFALLLERLEAEFYEKGLAVNGLVPAHHRRVIERIAKSEREHVTLLGTVTGRAVNLDKFDYTARGRFADVFSNYKTFLAIAQVFEDTGVRAYKGQAPRLIPAGPILSIALRIHSVEARHASQVRRMRGQKGWITGSEGGGLPGAAQPNYSGEGNTIQYGIQLSGIGGTPASAASEAFDEPLTKAQILRVVSPFIVETNVHA